MRESRLTETQEKCLRDQVITADQPGPVLRDFRTLLDFVGPKGLEVGGKYNLLPLKYIGELDRLMSRPLNLELKRPQLRSHPYLQGLYLLLRATGLSRVEGVGAKARLVLDPVMLEQWNRLNPTEQYFNLLEAWLRFGRAEMVGERGGIGRDLLISCLQTWRFIPKKGRRFDPKNPEEGRYFIGVGRDLYLLALMDLFGLLGVEQPPPPITSWSPARLKHVPFGDAVFSLIPSMFNDVFTKYSLREDEEEDEEDEDQGEEEDEDQGEEEEDEDQGEDEEEDEDQGEEDEDEGPEVPRFGAWQPLFQPYFPEWRENLEFPELEPREGTFIFRVTLGEIWRLIAMPADDTLDDLLGWILRSVKFDSDHLYEFTYRDRLGAQATALHPEMDEGPWADQIPIGTLPLEPGQTMQLHYDFGDDWRFTVKLERVEPPDVKIKAPRILESHGKAPEQYPNWDE